MANQPNSYKKLLVSFKTPSIDSAPDIVIGRTKIVESLWRRVESGSIRLLSERRMGKTWVLMLAIALKPQWAVPFFFNAESAHSAPEFVWQLNRELHRRNLIAPKWWEKVQDWFRRLSQRLQGKKAGTLEVPDGFDPWQALLEDTCIHFAKRSMPRQAVLMIDELPFFLDKIMKNRGPHEAIDVLDKLRFLRQTIPTLRMILCGSLGLHIVLQRLREVGYTGQPVNDIPPFELSPLTQRDASYLSGCLLLGEDVPCSKVEEVAQSVAQASSGVPFYIQHIVSWMSEQTGIWTPDRALSVPQELFDAPGDPTEFSYYDRRLDQYYPEDIVEKARAALDVLSQRKDSLHFDELLYLVRHRPKTLMVDAESFLKVLSILRDDHYIVHKDKEWCFKLEILRHWWLEARGGLAL